GTTMNFLVILITLVVNYLWLKDVDRFDDAWFFRFRRRVEGLAGRLGEEFPLGWFASLLLVYALPLVVLWLLLSALNGSMLGLPLMLLHILVLLIALDRTQPGQLARDFLSYWYRGDVSECARWVEQELAVPGDVSLSDEDSISRFFSKQLVYRFFERLFVMFFWYLLAGPLGVLFSYISYQLRDSHREDQDLDEVDFINLVISLLEWLPVRLLALTFSLAGNFVQCFERIKQSFWSFSRDAESADMLYGYASCALSGMGSVGEAATDAPAQEESAEIRRRRQHALEVEALQALLERSQAIWLALLAVATILPLA
ncbi:MAG: regulatory signaling modulator protein AmpE, partial [Pseudohongiellaceae bacterium]